MMFGLNVWRLKIYDSGMDKPTIEIISVAFERLGELKVFVQCILNQRQANWKLRVIHDGPNEEFRKIMQHYAEERPEQIFYEETRDRYNDWGHSLREIGLAHATGDYVLITNADNYYIPRFIGYVTEAIEQTNADMISWDMVHSHESPGESYAPSYSYFRTEWRRFGIDMGAAVVRRSLAQRAGFPDKGHDGDATYFIKCSEIKGQDTLCCRIPRVMLVHN